LTKTTKERCSNYRDVPAPCRRLFKGDGGTSRGNLDNPLTVTSFSKLWSRCKLKVLAWGSKRSRLGLWPPLTSASFRSSWRRSPPLKSISSCFLAISWMAAKPTLVVVDAGDKGTTPLGIIGEEMVFSSSSSSSSSSVSSVPFCLGGLSLSWSAQLWQKVRNKNNK
jgi:hypothetical protein